MKEFVIAQFAVSHDVSFTLGMVFSSARPAKDKE